MKTTLAILTLAAAGACASLMACTALQQQLPPFEQRYPVEMSALTGSRMSAAMLLEAGVIDADAAANTLDATDAAALVLQVARSIQAPGPSVQYDALQAADERARARLVAALAAAGR